VKKRCLERNSHQTDRKQKREKHDPS
jgi:hypothetical protein